MKKGCWVKKIMFEGDVNGLKKFGVFEAQSGAIDELRQAFEVAVALSRIFSTDTNTAFEHGLKYRKRFIDVILIDCIQVIHHVVGNVQHAVCIGLGYNGIVLNIGLMQVKFKAIFVCDYGLTDNELSTDFCLRLYVNNHFLGFIQ